jgi:hypothetical protein
MKSFCSLSTMIHWTVRMRWVVFSKFFNPVPVIQPMKLTRQFSETRKSDLVHTYKVIQSPMVRLQETVWEIILRENISVMYNQWSTGQSILVSGTHLEPATNFSPFFNYFLGSYRFVDVLYNSWLSYHSFALEQFVCIFTKWWNTTLT